MRGNLQRALLLFDQSRFELAEEQLRLALAAEPHSAMAHALLALCLAKREQYQPATDEAHEAILGGPDYPFAHYTLASVLHDRNRFEEAYASIQEAVRLDPADAQNWALLAQIELNRRRWRQALEAAERGLQIDAEHVACTNLSAIALLKLGRKREAGATIDAALAKNPQSAVTHANRGWTLLDHNDTRSALEHFRESLRLDPENEWARQGIVEALKARNVVYAVMLRYFLWMSRLSRRAQWGIIIGGYMLYRVLGGISRTNPELAPILLPLQIAYVVFAILTWTADPLFNLLLRLNRFGRMALSREQVVSSNWIGASMLAAVGFLGVCLMTSFDSPFIVGALVFGLLMMPLSGVFKCDRGWPRNVMTGYTSILALVGITTLALALSAEMLVSGPRQKELFDIGGLLLGIFALGILLSAWIANFLITRRPHR